MKISNIEFGSLLTYSPRGTTDEEARSRTFKAKLKTDEYLEKDNILMTEYIAQGIKNNLERLPFAHFFNTDPILIPTPNSSLTKANTLWVPQRLATALVNNGLGKKVSSCLERIKPLRKSHTSSSANRPKAQEHYDTMVVQKELSEPDEILLIDDFITRGSTFIGAANRLIDAFPNANIRAFAGIKTISRPEDFRKIYDPCIGTIHLINGDSFNDCVE